MATKINGAITILTAGTLYEADAGTNIGLTKSLSSVSWCVKGDGSSEPKVFETHPSSKGFLKCSKDTYIRVYEDTEIDVRVGV